MRWPADVLAYMCLRGGMTHPQATVAVAIALAATEGDDAYLWQSETPGGRSFVGAWAIPTDLLDGAELETAGRLSGSVAIVRRLTGPQGDDWAWSPVFAVGDWRKRLEDATAAVAHPQPGITDDTVQMRLSMADAVQAARSAIVDAKSSMLATIEHLLRQV